MNSKFFEPSEFGLTSDKKIYIGQPFNFSEFNLEPSQLSFVDLDQIMKISALIPDDSFESVFHSLKFDFKFYLLPLEKDSKPIGLVDTKLAQQAIEFLLQHSESTVTLSEILVTPFYIPTKQAESFNLLSFIKDLELGTFFKSFFRRMFKFIIIKLFIIIFSVSIPFFLPSIQNFLNIS